MIPFVHCRSLLCCVRLHEWTLSISQAMKDCIDNMLDLLQASKIDLESLRVI